MSNPEYLYACQRAELLGQAAPTEEEWAATRKDVGENEDPEALEDAAAQNLDQSDESMRQVGGGLDELTSILSATQKKINRFKTVCGSLGTLLRVRVSSRNNTPDHKPLASPSSDAEKSATNELLATDETLTIEKSDDETVVVAGNEQVSTKPKKIDLNEKVGSHLDKLDSLISKAENAQYSMQHQTKQMKKIINK